MTRSVHNSQLLQYVISPMESNPSFILVLPVWVLCFGFHLARVRSDRFVEARYRWKSGLWLCTFSLWWFSIEEQKKIGFFGSKTNTRMMYFCLNTPKLFFYTACARSTIFLLYILSCFYRLCFLHARPFARSLIFIRSLSLFVCAKCVYVCASLLHRCSSHSAIVCFMSLSSFRYWFDAYVIF